MKRTLIALSVAAAALMASSCLGHGSYTNNRSTNDNFDYRGLLVDYPDSVMVGGYFVGTSGEFVYNVGVDEAKEHSGGFVISAKYDKDLSKRGEKCNEYCAYETTGKGRTIFAVYYQNPQESLNPEEKSGIIFLGSTMADCRPSLCQITNTGLVADMIINGAEGFEPFKQGDYLKVTFIGYKNDVKGASVSKDLARYDGTLTVLKEWTDMELKGLGSVTSVDVRLESNRPDLPLYVCIDNFNTQITEEN
ncbi:MAG: DUF4465 domain-containing protein [Bacteroidales bacterium]|nr:DUF4465 domain-containing protein [Bacteroidales bacterium]